MRCETCHGEGWVRQTLPNPVPVAEEPVDEEMRGLGLAPVFIEVVAIRVPCPECGGCGWGYCCSGEHHDG